MQFQKSPILLAVLTKLANLDRIIRYKNPGIMSFEKSKFTFKSQFVRKTFGWLISISEGSYYFEILDHIHIVRAKYEELRAVCNLK